MLTRALFEAQKGLEINQLQRNIRARKHTNYATKPMAFLGVTKEMAGFFEVGVAFSWKFEASASSALLLNPKIFTREPTNLF